MTYTLIPIASTSKQDQDAMFSGIHVVKFMQALAEHTQTVSLRDRDVDCDLIKQLTVCAIQFQPHDIQL